MLFLLSIGPEPLEAAEDSYYLLILSPSCPHPFQLHSCSVLLHSSEISLEFVEVKI